MHSVLGAMVKILVLNKKTIFREKVTPKIEKSEAFANASDFKDRTSGI